MANTHKKHILILGGSVVHVGAALFQKLNHIQVSMQRCVMNRQVPFFIGRVHPRSELAAERRLPCVHAGSMVQVREVLIMLDENLHALPFQAGF